MGTQSKTATTNQSVKRLEEFNHYRSRLFAIAYRMLGSVMDAEDMVQETFLRWRQVSEQDVKSTQAYLTTIITRLCIDRLRSAKVQREQYVGPWLPEPFITEHASDPNAMVELADSLTIGFLVLLERLSPLERAVFVLREAFEFDYTEIGRIVEKNAVNCRQIARRARQRLTDKQPRFQASAQQQEQLTRKFMLASQQGDLQGLIELFAEDITLWSDGGGQVAATLKPLHGVVKIARFLQAIHRRYGKLGVSQSAELVQVNGQPGIIYTLDGDIDSVVAVEIADSRVQTLYFLRNPSKLKRGFSNEIAEMLRISENRNKS